MKNSKKGISLIVLVITIVVIIILAAAVILTLNNNNPITQANKAVMDSDRSEIQAAVTLYLAKILAENGGVIPAAYDLPQGVIAEGAKIKKHNPSPAPAADLELNVWGIDGALGMSYPGTGKYTISYTKANGLITLAPIV